MKRSGKRLPLSRFVEAARSDLPTSAELRRGLGALLPPVTPRASGAPETGVHVVAPLVKSILGGALLLVTGGMLWISREPSEPPRPAVLAKVQKSVPVIPQSFANPALESAPSSPELTDAEALAAQTSHAVRGERTRAVTRRTRPSAVQGAQKALPRTAVTAPSLPRASNLPVPADRIEEEAALVEAARKALRQDPARTLALASEHVRMFPSGVLGVEREALTIQALVLLGRTREARAHLQVFAQVHPRSIHVARLRAVLEARGSPTMP